MGRCTHAGHNDTAANSIFVCKGCNSDATENIPEKNTCNHERQEFCCSIVIDGGLELGAVHDTADDTSIPTKEYKTMSD
jgi:hypothetical protein